MLMAKASIILNTLSIDLKMLRVIENWFFLKRVFSFKLVVNGDVVVVGDDG